MYQKEILNRYQTDQERNAYINGFEKALTYAEQQAMKLLEDYAAKHKLSNKNKGDLYQLQQYQISSAMDDIRRLLYEVGLDIKVDD